jgi:hypothetical protein
MTENQIVSKLALSKTSSLVDNYKIDRPKRTTKRKILKRIYLGHKISENTDLGDKNVDFFNGSTLDNKNDRIKPIFINDSGGYLSRRQDIAYNVTL